MELRVTHTLPEDGPSSGPVRVGWLLNEERGGVYNAPLRAHSVKPSRGHAKSASRCPAPDRVRASQRRLARFIPDYST